MCLIDGEVGESLLKFLTSRRGPFQIIAEILDVCTKPQAKTHVMHKVNLSYHQLQFYLGKLRKFGLIELRSRGERYVASGKGLLFLQKWIETYQMLIDESDFVLTRNPMLTNGRFITQKLA